MFLNTHTNKTWLTTNDFELHCIYLIVFNGFSPLIIQKNKS